MQLQRYVKEFASSIEAEEEKSIDFSAAGLYLPAAQTIFATTLASLVSVLTCWLIPVGAISAVRTLALTAIAGFVVVRKPLQIGRTKGINTIFSALRPCCFIYVGSLVLEQLIHTCISEESTYEHGFWRRIMYHVSMTVMVIAAFVRSRSPRSESDFPFLLSSTALLAVAILPPPALALSGPLCSPPTLFVASERIVRAFLFSLVYVVLVYSAAPLSNNLTDTVVCIARSSTASAWVLGSISYILPLALLQVSIILYCSFNPTQLQYEGVVPLDLESVGSDASVALDRAPTPTLTEEDVDVAAALSAMKHQKPNVQAVNGNGLSFSLHPVPNGLVGISNAVQ